MAFRIPYQGELTLTKAKPVKRGTYLQWIRQLPCCVTGTRPVEAAHLSTARPELGHFGRGKQQKASDRWTLPMSPDEHRRSHDIGEHKYWFRQGVDPYTLCLVLHGLWSDYGPDATEHAERIILRGLKR